MSGFTLFPPEKLRRYPHLMVSDVVIWERFLEQQGSMWEYFAYDVRVGEGVELGPEESKNMKTMARALWEKRIDVVGIKRGLTYLIEVKPSAMLSAIGQILCYSVLYKDRFPLSPTPEKMLVTDRVGPDLLRLASFFSIDVVVV